MTVTIRPMRPQDVTRVAEIDRAAGIALPWTVNQYARELLKPSAFCWVAEEEGQVVGSLTLWNLAGEGEIANVAVHPACWRRGGGRALLQTALTQAAALGLTRLLLEVAAGNQAAQALYRSFGFSEDGRRPHYYANGEDALLMSRPLIE